MFHQQHLGEGSTTYFNYIYMQNQPMFSLACIVAAGGAWVFSNKRQQLAVGGAGLMLCCSPPFAEKSLRVPISHTSTENIIPLCTHGPMRAVRCTIMECMYPWSTVDACYRVPGILPLCFILVDSLGLLVPSGDVGEASALNPFVVGSEIHCTIASIPPATFYEL